MNFLVDTLLLILALRSAGASVTRRVWLGGGMGAAYALGCLWLEPLKALPCQAAAMAAMLALAGRNVLRAGTLLALAAASAALAGVMQWLLPRIGWRMSLLLSVLAVLLAGRFMQDRRRLSFSQLHIRVRIVHRGETSEFDALIDTGNLMTEPLSGLPVLIVESHHLPQIPPVSGMDVRRIPYAGLGGEGLLRAFRPDCVYRQTAAGWQCVPGVWAAAFPGRIAGEFQALAPAVFAQIMGEKGHTRGENSL